MDNNMLSGLRGKVYLFFKTIIGLNLVIEYHSRTK